MTRPLPRQTPDPPIRPGAPVGDEAGQLPIGPGTVLGDRYRLEERVGDGGTATVYRATDTVLLRRVAVKVFRSNPMDVALPERRAREMRLAAAVSSPNLVAVYDAHPGTVTRMPRSLDDLCYLVVEYIEGPTLSDSVAAGPLDEAEVRRVGREVATALSALHANGLVHRDVKPGNVLVSQPGPVKLADLGIAREVDGEPLTRDDAVPGTAPYMSPEQALGRSVGPPSDIYSLGLVLLECLTGRREFPGAPMEAAIARLLREPVIPDHLTGRWPDVVRSMTHKDPDRRPTAGEVVEMLTDPGGPSAQGGADRPAGSTSRRRLLAWVAAVVATAALIGGLFALRGQDEPAPAQPSGTTDADTPDVRSTDPTVLDPTVLDPTVLDQPSVVAPAPALPATGEQSPTEPSGAAATPVTAESAGEPAVGPVEPAEQSEPTSDPPAGPPGNGNGGGNGNGNNGNGGGNGNNGNGGNGNNGNGNGNGGGNGNGNGRGNN